MLYVIRHSSTLCGIAIYLPGIISLLLQLGNSLYLAAAGEGAACRQYQGERGRAGCPAGGKAGAPAVYYPAGQ